METIFIIFINSWENRKNNHKAFTHMPQMYNVSVILSISEYHITPPQHMN